VLFLPAGNRRLPFSVSCPTVGTVHDFSSIHVTGKYDPARRFYITKVLPVFIRRLSRVITVSESSKKDIVEFAEVPGERVTVIPLGVDQARYYPRSKQESLSKIVGRYSITPPYILYISRIEHPGKNHVRLIEAFSRLKAATRLPHQLVLTGSDWTRAEVVHQAAEKSPYAGNILFSGFAPADDLPDLYCGAELFVFPSLYEGFGLPLLEAMTCGTPVVCSELSSLPEVARGSARMFDPYSVEAIAETMETLLTDEDLQKSYIQRGLEQSDGFSWSHSAELTLEVITRCAEQGG